MKALLLIIALVCVGCTQKQEEKPCASMPEYTKEQRSEKNLCKIGAYIYKHRAELKQ